jgi:hypothetical protein
MDELLNHLDTNIIQPNQIATGKIFVSYSRKNRDFAKALYAKLKQMNFDLWRDADDLW